MKRFLITTEDERSWKFDRPVLFLGEWCRLFERKHIWEAMDAIVARPYGLPDKEKNLAYVQQLAGRLLQEVAEALNVFHHTQHGLRYWHIVIGPWLQRYVATIFNRYHALEQVLIEQDIAGTVVFDLPDYQLATNDSLSLIRASHDPMWNHVLYSRILDFLERAVDLRVGSCAIERSPGRRHEIAAQGAAQGAAHQFGLRQRFRNAVLNTLTKFRKKNDAFILNSYLPFFQEICLQLSLGQVPQVWKSKKVNHVPADAMVRRKFFIDTEGYAGFELFVRHQLREMIPTCYLEGYGLLLEQVKSQPWPSEPKFIFTSNNFEFDEVFEVWAASMAEQGVPYFTGQHGNNYGTRLGCQNWPELVTCDRFFTWGWTNGATKNIPAFVFNIASRKLKPKKTTGGLLLVELVVPPRVVPEDSFYLFGEYQEDQFRFAEALPASIQQQLTVRLYRGYKNFPWGDEQRWNSRNPNIRLDTGGGSIQDAMANSRLVVFSYDSTGLLENLALNIPTMCFWRGGLDHLLPGAKPYFELLRGAGIIIDTPEAAAELVSLRWENVDEWWESNEVQEARKLFCARYARTEKAPVRTLKKLLTTHACLAKNCT